MLLIHIWKEGEDGLEKPGFCFRLLAEHPGLSWPQQDGADTEE